LLTIELECDFTNASAKDSLSETIDYAHLAQSLSTFGEGREWKLIETLSVEVADMILRQYNPKHVTVEVKKFILPQTRWVSVRVQRPNA
jgi:FolB domain-containing protein